MGTVIRATGLSTASTTGSSIHHAASAAHKCLQTASVHPDDVQILINVGVYRDKNMVEPAMSALIQKELGMHLDFMQSGQKRPGFSFDLMNGACGALNAIQVADACLRSEQNQYVLVVSGDAHPSGQSPDDFPYACLGGAMLLQSSPDPNRGFSELHVALPDGPVGVQGYVDIHKEKGTGRDHITVAQDADYLQRCHKHLVEALGPQDLCDTNTLLIPPQLTAEFPGQLAAALGLSLSHVVAVEGIDKDPHTSSIMIGYHQAMMQSRIHPDTRVVFAAVGAGMNISWIEYRP